MHSANLFVFFAVLPTVAFAPDSIAPEEEAALNAGVHTAEPHSKPWQVLLKRRLNPAKYCAASLLRVREDVDKSDILVTAAHCVTKETSSPTEKPEEYEPSMLSATLGNHFTDGVVFGQKQRHIAKVRAHPDYKGEIGRSDIALVKMAVPIRFVETIAPVSLAKQGQEAPAQKCAATGWSRFSASEDDKSEVLKEMVVRVLSDANSCANKEYAEDEMVCAGSPKSGPDTTCSAPGDYGSMLACGDDKGGYTLYGATSLDEVGCQQEGSPSLFPRVSKYAKWIEDEAKKMTSVTQKYKVDDLLSGA